MKQLQEIRDHKIKEDLNASEVVKSFANENILSVFFKYKEENEKESVLKLIDKSDICVLDWKLTLTDKAPSEGEGEGEEDVEETEGRGRHAIALIKEMIECQHNSPKLIFVYSAEYGGDIKSSIIVQPGEFQMLVREIGKLPRDKQKEIARQFLHIVKYRIEEKD